jgi:hypothetical protein
MVEFRAASRISLFPFKKQFLLLFPAVRRNFAPAAMRFRITPAPARFGGVLRTYNNEIGGYASCIGTLTKSGGRTTGGADNKK